MKKNFKHKVAQTCGLMMEAEIFLVESQLVRRLLCGIKVDVFLFFLGLSFFFIHTDPKTTKDHEREQKI